VATAAYQPVPAAAAAARRFVRETLASWELSGEPHALVDDAVLLTSELVTNAVLHAGTPVQVTCRLVGEEPEGAVEIAVLDRRPGQLHPDMPHSAAEAAERTNGRGLQMPSQLASAWGVTYAGTAKAVWFRMNLAGPKLAAGPDSAAASVPEQFNAARSSAPRPADPEGPVGYPRSGRGASWFDDLLVSTVETARDIIGADASYLLHTGAEGESPVCAAAAQRCGQAVSAAASLPASAARALAAGALSLVTVPLRVDGKVTGLLAAAAAEPGRFTENDAARLQHLADRSAPALELARLRASDLV